MTLDLTPQEPYIRHNAAYRFRRYRASCSMIAPDVRQHYRYKTYTKEQKEGGTTLSVKIFGTKILSRWGAPYSMSTIK